MIIKCPFCGHEFSGNDAPEGTKTQTAMKKLERHIRDVHSDEQTTDREIEDSPLTPPPLTPRPPTSKSIERESVPTPLAQKLFSPETVEPKENPFSRLLNRIFQLFEGSKH